MKFAFSVTFSAQSCRDPCPYKASWPSCAASDYTYQATAELEYGADVTAPTLTGLVPGPLWPVHSLTVHPSSLPICDCDRLDLTVNFFSVCIVFYVLCLLLLHRFFSVSAFYKVFFFVPALLQRFLSFLCFCNPIFIVSALLQRIFLSCLHFWIAVYRF